MHRQIRNKLQQNSNSPRSIDRPEKHSWQNSSIRDPTLTPSTLPTMIAATAHTYAHTHARAHKPGCVLAAVFPVQWRGGRKPVSRLSRYTRIYRERSPCSRRRGGVVRYTARGMNERNEGWEEGGREGGGRAGGEPVFERSWRKWWLIPHLLTYITLVSPPPSTPTIGRHKLSRYNAAYGTAGGRPVDRPLLPCHRCDPLNDTSPPPPNRARVSPLLDKIMSRWRAHLGRNSSTRPGRGSLDNHPRLTRT